MQLDDEFFWQQGGDEISGGDVEVMFTAVRETANTVENLDVTARMKGILRIPCTRCLDDMDWPVDLADSFSVVVGAGGREDDEDTLVADANGMADMGQRICETLTLNIPSVHVHANGGCNPAMEKLLEEHSAGKEMESEI